jgi:hypothetical protein
VNQDLDLVSWADCLRAWPNPPEDWVSWYTRVSKTYQSSWETTGIADALYLSLSPLEKHENLLKTIGYFWSDALNCFMFGHGPMTPTLLDVVMITGLDITSLALLLLSCHVFLSSFLPKQSAPTGAPTLNAI